MNNPNRDSPRPAAVGGVVVAEVDSDSPHRVLTPPGRVSVVTRPACLTAVGSLDSEPPHGFSPSGRVLRTRPATLTAVGCLVVDEGDVGVVDFAAPLQGVGYLAPGSGGAGAGVAGTSEHHAAEAVYS